MARRITCYVVFVTLIWGAHTVDEEKVRDVFKSNMTRNDFSNLLQSLIKLNENRVSVLQKLYRLEDYGVLSEVLRSGEKKTGNGNPNNLYLIVMSKKPNDPSRRKADFQVEDSVTSLDAGNDNIHPKLDFVLDPAGFIFQNIRKENRLESIFENIPRVYEPIRKHREDDESKKITTTTKTLNYDKAGLSTEVKYDKAITSFKENEDRKHHKENNRFEIVSNKGRLPTASEKLLDYDGNSNKYPQTVGYNTHSNEYLDFTIENDKLTTESIIIKHILSSNHKKSKYPLEGKDELDKDDYSSLFSNNKNDHKNPYISNKKRHGHNHHNPKTNKYTPKVKVQSNQQNYKLTTKPIIITHILSSNHKKSEYPLEGKDELDEDDYGTLFNNNKNDHNSPHISNKKLHGNNHHNSKTNEYTPKVKNLRNQQNNKLNTKPIKHILSSNHKNSKYPLEGKETVGYYSQSNEYFDFTTENEKLTTKPIIIKPILSSNNKNSKYPLEGKETVGYYSQSNEYFDFTIENEKLTTKPIIIKPIISSNNKHSKYPLEGKDELDEDDYGFSFSTIKNNHTSPYISNKKLHGNNHNNPKTNKYTPNVKVQSNQQNYKLNTKPIIIKHILSSNHKKSKYPLEGKDENHKNSKYPLEGKETVGYYTQSNEYRDFTIENNKLTTKPITIKHLLSSNHKKSKYPLEGKDELDEDDYSFPFSTSKNDQTSPYVSNKKLYGNNHHISKTNKYTPKVKVQSNQQNYKVNTMPIIIKHILSSNHKKSKYPLEGKDELDEDDYNFPFSTIKNDHTSPYISNKKLYGNNHHISKTNKYTPKVKVQSNQQNDKLTIKPIIIKHILSSNHKKPEYPLEGKDELDEDDYDFPFSTIKNDHTSPYISNKKLYGYNHHISKTNKYTPKVQVQSNQQNDKLTTKPIKQILSSNHKKSKYPLEGKDELDEDDYDFPFSTIKNDHTSPYISNKKLYGNHHHISKTNKYTPKVQVQSNQQNDKLTTKPTKQILSSNHKKSKYPLEGKDELDEDDYNFPFSTIKNDHMSPYISNKKLYGNHHHISKTNKYTPKVKVQSNQQNDKLTIKPIIIKHILSSNHKKSEYPLEGKDELDEDDYGTLFSNNKNDYNSQHTKMDSDISIKKLHGNNHHISKTNKYTPKVNNLRNQQNNKLITKPIIIKHILSSNHKKSKYPLEGELDEDDYGFLFTKIENDHNIQHTKMDSDITIKKFHGNNHHNLKTNKYTPKIKVQSNQPSKLNQYKFNLNNQGFKHSKIKMRPIDIETATRKKYYKINGTVNNSSEYNYSIKNSNLIHANKHDHKYTKIKHIYNATKEIDNNNKFLTIARENIYGSKPVIPETTKDTQYGSYPNFEDHKDVRDNSNKDGPKTAEDTPGNYPGLAQQNDVMDNLNKDKPKAAKDLRYGDNLNAESKKDIDYDGVKMFDNGKKSSEKLTILITDVGNGTAEEVKQQNYPKLILNAFDQPEGKPILRKPFEKCLNKKASKLCTKSCISAYKNVCRRLKCTSRSKRALKTECKRSCKKTFASSSSKYSDEDSDEYSDESYSDDDY